jgi:zinc transporter ZupT
MSGMKLDKLMDGEQPSEKLGWGMICGFSIPIITICAFIVLQIFLSLFHILFWWLPFIRICIPFPRKESN